MAAEARFQAHPEEVLAALRIGVDGALDAMGGVAREAAVGQLLHGYGRPVRQTGALIGDVGYEVGDGVVDVGNGLGYALYVHEGTARVAGRPYLRDGIMGAQLELKRVACEAIQRAMG